jgi:hypothetical protein
MSTISYFKRSANYLSSNASISVVDTFGNKAYCPSLNSSFYPQFLDNTFDTNIPSGLIQPGLRAIYPGIVIFERPPSMQMVQYVAMNMDGINEHEEEYEEYPDVYRYYIPVPWQVYVASYSLYNNNPVLNSVKMFFAKEPLTHKNVELYLPYIPNFFTNGTLCAPHFDDSDEIYRYPADISGIIASAYDWVWNTGFNQDLIDGPMTNINYSYTGNNPVVKHIRQNPSIDLVTSFYKKISEYTPQDVVSFDWVPPSYTTYFDSGGEISYLYTLPAFQQDCVSDLDIEIPSDSSFQDYISLSQFSEWIGDYHHIPKTYADIMNSILLDPNNKSEYRSNHRISYLNIYKQSPSPSMFVNTMLSYVNNIQPSV